MTDQIVKLRKKVKRCLDRERYEHTMGVMHTAGCLAMRYEEDMEKAIIAGLLHDCAKTISNDEKLKLCKKYHLDISPVEARNPGLLHAKLGAFISWKKYHIEDRSIIQAIAAHTTGRPNMTLLDKIIYIADYIEPGRDEAPNLPDVRALAFIDLDACLYRILEDSLTYLKEKGVAIDPMTEKTYLYYKNVEEKKKR